MTLQEYILSSELSPQELFIELNEKSVPKFIKISTKEIKRYLIMSDKWISLQIAATNDDIQVSGLSRTVLDTLNNFQRLHYDDKHVRMKIDYMLDMLKVITVLEQTQVDHIKAMGQTKISKASEFGFSKIRFETIIGNLGDTDG